MIDSHQDITSNLADEMSWETDFKNYLTYGYDPFFKESKQPYFGKLEKTAHLVITPFEGLNYKSIHSLKNYFL